MRSRFRGAAKLIFFGSFGAYVLAVTVDEIFLAVGFFMELTAALLWLFSSSDPR